MPKGSLEASATPRPHAPLLRIDIRLDGADALLFEIDAPDPLIRINSKPLPVVPLKMPPDKFLHHLFKGIENLSLKTEEDRQVAERKLGIKGLTLWKLFPPELQELLWKWRSKRLTLLIQSSNEPYIPWEIAKLRNPDRNSRTITGKFLCEAFAVTRWLRGTPYETRLPMQNPALVVPRTSRLAGAAAEKEEMRSLAARYGRTVSEVEPTFSAVRQAMSSGVHDGWHFAGHGAAFGDDANLWNIDLDGPNGSHPLSPEDLLDETKNLGRSHPLVFFNGCKTGRHGLTLTGQGGWSNAFLEATAGAFIGTHWEVPDGKSRELAIAAYEDLFKGKTIGEAFLRARRSLHKKYPGDPTWLAYTVFAHPMASCSGQPGDAPVAGMAERKPSQLAVPVRPWRNGDSPGALLRAQYGVVPFHRRDKELGELEDWCRDPSPARVRLYTGPGGMGKTRLALEASLRMRDEGWWTGFVTSEALQSPEKTWKALARLEGKLLLIVDYAETNRPFLISVLREMYRLERGPVRLVLLARAALDWWEQLKMERDGVGELLSGAATSRYSLQPLADSVEARASSYNIAAKAFSERLQTPASEPLDNLEADYYQRVLLLHMKALIDMEAEEKATGEDGILDRVLARERRFWESRTEDYGIPRATAAGIGRGMAVITLGGGVQGENEALEALRGLNFFADQPTAVLTGVARLLHECYPGERWIEPLQPDLLGEHLAQRELEAGADELLDLVLGPRSESIARGPQE